MKAWLTLYQRSLALGGASEVIARRVHMMGHSPWSPATWFEMNQMVSEKMLAASESWWSMCSSPATWWLPATNRALLPYTRRVNANLKRLRKR